jgi:proteic killer suppression protein
LAIQSFKSIELRHFFEKGIVPKKAAWHNVHKIALRKLDLLHHAKSLKDLLAPPQNRLEGLKGDLIGYYSIRINDQFRIIFKWHSSGPSEVEIIDYHF